MQLTPDELRHEIDDTLKELDRLEVEVVELFREIVGPEAALHVADYMRAKAHETDLQLRPGASSGPSTTRLETQ